MYTMEVLLHNIDGHDSCSERQLRVSSTHPVKVGRSSKTGARNVQPARDNAFIDSPVISRDHAEFTLVSTGVGKPSLFITDTGSMHGTFVNGKKLERNVRSPVPMGSNIRFGASITRFNEDFPARSYEVREHRATTSNDSKDAQHGFEVPYSSDEDIGSSEMDESDAESDSSAPEEVPFAKSGSDDGLNDPFHDLSGSLKTKVHHASPQYVIDDSVVGAVLFAEATEDHAKHIENARDESATTDYQCNPAPNVTEYLPEGFGGAEPAQDAVWNMTDMPDLPLQPTEHLTASSRMVSAPYSTGGERSLLEDRPCREQSNKVTYSLSPYSHYSVASDLDGYDQDFNFMSEDVSERGSGDAEFGEENVNVHKAKHDGDGHHDDDLTSSGIAQGSEKATEQVDLPHVRNATEIPSTSSFPTTIAPETIGSMQGFSRPSQPMALERIIDSVSDVRSLINPEIAPYERQTFGNRANAVRVESLLNFAPGSSRKEDYSSEQRAWKPEPMAPISRVHLNNPSFPGNTNMDVCSLAYEPSPFPALDSLVGSQEPRKPKTSMSISEIVDQKTPSAQHLTPAPATSRKRKADVLEDEDSTPHGYVPPEVVCHSVPEAAMQAGKEAQAQVVSSEQGSINGTEQHRPQKKQRGLHFGSAVVGAVIGGVAMFGALAILPESLLGSL